MEFLADESCDHTIINHLRTAGIDVLSISEKSPGISDKEVLVFAQEQERILITEDRDFGRLVHLGGENPHPVLYLRYPFNTRPIIIEKATGCDRKEKRFFKKFFYCSRTRANQGTEIPMSRLRR